MNKSNREADRPWNDFYELAAIMALLIVVPGLVDVTGLRLDSYFRKALKLDNING